MRITVSNTAGGTMRSFHSLHRLAEFAATRKAPLGGWKVWEAYSDATAAELDDAAYLLSCARDAMREWRMHGRAVPQTAAQWREFSRFAECEAFDASRNVGEVE